MKRSPIKRVGKKTKRWNLVRASLKKEFEENGITTCEVRLRGCLNNWALTMAHSKKRRNITTTEGLREVALACVHCHKIIELKPESEMNKIITDIIKNRKS